MSPILPARSPQTSLRLAPPEDSVQRAPVGAYSGRLSARATPGPPLEMVVGMPVKEAATALPKLFSLCKAAEGLVVRKALGLPDDPGATDALRREILREHMAKLCLHWPVKLCLPARPLPNGWQDGKGVARALFGPGETAPETPAEVEAYLECDTGAAPVLRGIDRCFAPGVAIVPSLPWLNAKTAFEAKACENSVAARQAHRPALLHIEATRGRGPLWRAMARVWDVSDALSGRFSGAISHGNGTASVEAARGTYSLTASAEDGTVSALTRITPTDHLLAFGGILSHMLATLPPDRESLAPLLLDIVDPCVPVHLDRA